MKIRATLLLMLALSLILVACSQKSSLRFKNETECGTATIALTNTETGNIKEYTVDEGKEFEIEIEPDKLYSYEVTYPRQPNFVVCEAKRVTTAVSKGQTINISLQSVRNPSLDNDDNP